MKLFLFGLLLGVVPATAGGQPVQVTEVTLYERFEQEAPAPIELAIRNEVAAVMGPLGFHMNWRLLSEVRGNEVVSQLVVITFRGRCDAVGLQVNSVVPTALGWTHVSDGEILPFSEVDCDRVRNFVQKNLMREGLATREALFGRALGRVLAHELYHVLADTKSHVSAGVGKAAFSVFDLLEDDFTFEKIEPSVFRHPVTHNALLPETRDGSAIIPSGDSH